MKCAFFIFGSRCAILKECECDGCKFRKTKTEKLEGMRKANEMLKKKGLKKVKKINSDGTLYMSVEKLKGD